LRKKASKREVELKREKKDKEVKERELQRVREEAFGTIGAIYIESLASRLPLIFQEGNESYGEERDRT
jgi:sortase (surface protein transpeptidase)